MANVIVHGDSLIDQQTLTVKTCPVCGIRYAAPARFFEIKDRDAGSWHCPNGHSLVFTEPEAKRLEKKLTRTRAELDQARAMASDERQRREAAERSRAATKGALTKARRRAAAAMCPVPGCKRQIVQMARHLRSIHPEWTDEHIHEDHQ